MHGSGPRRDQPTGIERTRNVGQGATDGTQSLGNEGEHSVDPDRESYLATISAYRASHIHADSSQPGYRSLSLS